LSTYTSLPRTTFRCQARYPPWLPGPAWSCYYSLSMDTKGVTGLRHRVRRSRDRAMSPRELAFVEAYLGVANGNATEAARLAGYDGETSTLGSVGSKLLRRPRVNRAIGRALAKRHATNPEILGELSEIALSPWRDHVQVQMDDEGNVVSAKLRLADKVRALEILGKASGATQDPLSRAIERMLNKAIEGVERAREMVAEKERAALTEGAPLDNQVETIDAELIKAAEVPSTPAVAAQVAQSSPSPGPRRGRPLPRATRS
jgi:phage terminase small subunit